MILVYINIIYIGGNFMKGKSNELRKPNYRRSLFSFCTAVFMILSSLGDCLSVFAATAAELGKPELKESEKAQMLEFDENESFLGIASAFSIFTKNDLTIPSDQDGRSDIEGRAAVGGSINLATDYYDIGGGYEGNGASVIVRKGRLGAITQNRDKIYVVGSNVDLHGDYEWRKVYISDDLIDFDAEFENLKKISSDLKSYAPTATSTTFNEEKGVVVFESDTEGLNIINLTSEEWNKITANKDRQYDLEIHVPGDPLDSYYIFNIGGKICKMPYSKSVIVESTTTGERLVSAHDASNTHDRNKELDDHILYNLYEADEVGLEGSLEGSVLAPLAEVSGPVGGHISGAVIADSIPSLGIQIGVSTFKMPKLKPKNYDYYFAKTDAEGNNLSGAVMALISNDSNSLENLSAGVQLSSYEGRADAVEWTTGSEPATFRNIPNGNYTLKEISAPRGYSVGKEFGIIIEDGKIKSAASGVAAPGETRVDTETSTVYYVNDLSDIFISKKAVNGTEELEGAVLTLTAADESYKFEGCVLPSSVTPSDNTLSWTSSDKPVEIKGIADGKYVLSETTAPEGYLKTESIDFEIKDGKLFTVGNQSNQSGNDTITMRDAEKPAPSVVSISKTDASGTEELEGAVLTLTSDDGADLREVTMSDEEAVIKKNSIKWTSGKTAAIVTGLPDGSYTLTESVAPDKYTVTGAVQFTLKDGKVVNNESNNIVMKDELSKINVSKKAANGADELPGAQLTITLTESTKSESVSLASVTVTSNGKSAAVLDRTKTSVTFVSGTEEAVVEGLPDGKYELKEISSPDGYTINTAVTKFEISDGILTNGEKAVNMTDTLSKISISKKDINGTDELEGAQLTLTLNTPSKTSGADLSGVIDEEVTAADEDNMSVTWTSGTASRVFTGLPDGDYTLTENIAPDGYTKSESINFTVKDGKIGTDDTVTMLDKPSEVSIKKTDVSGKEIEGAELTLTENGGKDISKSASGNVKKGSQNNQLTWISGTEAEVIKGLPDGSYTLTEVTAPNGFKKAESISFTIKEGVPSTSEVEMKDEYSEVVISKRSTGDNKEVPGAKLTVKLVKSADEKADLSNVKVEGGGAKSAVTEADSVTFVSGDTETILRGIPDGDYTLTENTAPVGYKLSEETVAFSVKDGVLSNTDGKTEDKVIMINYPVVVSVTKLGFEGNLAGAKLLLESSSDLSNVSSDTEIEHVDKNTIAWTSTDDAVSFTYLPDGKYTVSEAEAPDRYKLADSVTFNITNGKSDMDAVTVKDDISEVTIRKCDINDIMLKGAELVLERTDSDASLEGLVSSDADIAVSGGRISWTTNGEPVVFKGLPDGKYQITEVKAPEHYATASPVLFEIENGSVKDTDSNTVSVIDTELNTIMISKQAAAGSKEIPGAKLKLSYSGDADISTVSTSIKSDKVSKNSIEWTSGTKPNSIEGLPDGDYTLTESVAPDKYTVTGEISFTVKDGKVVGRDDNTVKMTDELSKVVISKKDVNGSDELPGAKLKLTLDNSTKNESANLLSAKMASSFRAKMDISEITWTSGNEAAVIEGLPDGEYTLTEMTSPDGYTVNEEKISFEIKDGKLADAEEVKMLDKPSELSVSKIDAAGSKEIPGAKLTLTLTSSSKSSGATLKDIDVKDAVISESGKSVTWTSTDKPVTLKKLPDGEYTLEESVAPDGYTITGAVKFIISDGKIKTTEMTVPQPGESYVDTKSGKVVMIDELSKTVISKQDVAGSEIPGAELKLTSKDNKDLSKVTSETQIKAKDNTVSWTSGKTPTVLEGLPDGTYVLEESVAPDRYAVTGAVTFTVKNGIPSESPVKMIDELSETVISKQNVSGDEIPGAKLKLTNKEGKDLTKTESETKIAVDSNIVTWTSGTAPTVLKGLPDGTYTLEESVAPDGYTITGAVTFTIENGKPSSSPVKMIDELSKTKISKQDVAGKEVPGAVLKLTNTDSKDLSNVKTEASVTKDANTITWTSGSAPVLFEGLPDGKYKLEESVAPDGYTITGAVEFTIENGKPSSSPVKMVDELSKVTVSKRDIAGEELPGALLTITGEKSLANVKSESDIKVNGKTITWTSGKTPVVLEGLPDGKYVLTEDDAPAGYDIAESVPFTIENGKVKEASDGVIIMTDLETPKPSEVVISKVNVAGNEIPGAKLTLTAADDKADLKDVKADGITVKNNKITWTSGTAPTLLTGLPDGEYTLEESVAPDGYTITGKISFVLEEGIVKESENNLIKMVDEYSEVSISKKDINKTEELPGAVLKITLTSPTKTEKASLENVTVENVSESTVKTSEKEISFESGAAPAVIKGIPDGKYTLTEITSPDGYTVNEETVEFEIKDGKPVSGSEVTMLDKPSTVKISKQDAAGSNEVPGAVLRLTLNTPSKNSSASLKNNAADGIKVSDDGMSLQWTSSDKPTEFTALPDGKYTLEESVAPDGYTITGAVEFVIENGKVKSSETTVVLPGESTVNTGENTVVMRDELSETVISKQNVTGEEIPGAKLKLTNTDGKDLSKATSETALESDGNTISWTSGTSAAVIKGLPDGTYTLEESVAPDGYTITGAITFTIRDGKPSEEKVVMVDELSKVTISKENVTGEEIPGAKLILTNTDNKDLSKVTSKTAITNDGNKLSWTSGTTPAVLEGLPDGKYTLEESVAPDGYTITGAISFTISNGKPSEEKVVMIDELSKVTISKVNVTGKEIPGAKLKLTNLDGKNLTGTKSENELIKEANTVSWTSGNTSTVLEGLPDGKYKLEESVAPDGYTVTGAIEFTIVNGKPSEEKIEMIDEYSSVSISKQDIAGKELSGAKLTVTGEKSLEGVISDTEITIKDNSVSWTSGSAPTVLKGLPDGTYTLTEVTAPKGYDVAESVTFTIKNGKLSDSKDSVVMIDKMTEVTTVTTIVTTVETTTTPEETTTVETTTTPEETTTVETTTTPEETTTVETTTTPEETTTTEETTGEMEFTVTKPTDQMGVSDTAATTKTETTTTTTVQTTADWESVTKVTTTSEETTVVTTDDDSVSVTRITTTTPAPSTTKTTTKKESSTPKTGESTSGLRTTAFLMAGAALSMLIFRKKNRNK